MGEVQEQRYACKVCGRTCASGRALGGHMRAHLVALAVASKKADIETAEYSEGGHDREGAITYQRNGAFSDADSDDDDDRSSSYGLRENPKKSWRISDSDTGGGLDASETGYACRECGKEFPTTRALSGHMRSHSIKNKKESHQCKKCGKGFDSIRAMFGHMKSHPKKRSSAPDDDGGGDGDGDDDDDSFSVLENICPVRKKRSTIRYNIATPNPSSSDLIEYNKCGAVFDVEDVEEVAESLIMLSKGVSVESSDGFVCGVGRNKGVCELAGLGSSFVAKDEIKSGCANELDKDFLVSNGANEEPAAETEARLGIVKGFEKKIELKCKIKEHECHVCFKVFPSGQALGGHKRAHYNSTGFGVSSERRSPEMVMIMLGQAVMNQELGAEVDDEVMLDLNFPVSVDEGAKRDAGKSLWCTEMGHEVLTI